VQYLCTLKANSYLSTLREVLLKQLLSDLMRAQKVSESICDRLFSDNFTHKQRLDKLFPSLTSRLREVEFLRQTTKIQFGRSLQGGVS
jgi:hypothetical protein